MNYSEFYEKKKSLQPVSTRSVNERHLKKLKADLRFWRKNADPGSAAITSLEQEIAELERSMSGRGDLRLDAIADTIDKIDRRLEEHERPRGIGETRADPPTSEKQRRAMHAAASGNSTLDIPKKVGEEFSEADPGGKLPESKKDDFNFPSSVNHKGKTYWATEKTGTHTKSGERSAEYRYTEDPRDTGRGIDRRVWMRLPSGTVEEE